MTGAVIVDWTLSSLVSWVRRLAIQQFQWSNIRFDAMVLEVFGHHQTWTVMRFPFPSRFQLRGLCGIQIKSCGHLHHTICQCLGRLSGFDKCQDLFAAWQLFWRFSLRNHDSIFLRHWQVCFFLHAFKHLLHLLFSRRLSPLCRIDVALVLESKGVGQRQVVGSTRMDTTQTKMFRIEANYCLLAIAFSEAGNACRYIGAKNSLSSPPDETRFRRIERKTLCWRNQILTNQNCCLSEILKCHWAVWLWSCQTRPRASRSCAKGGEVDKHMCINNLFNNCPAQSSI